MGKGGHFYKQVDTALTLMILQKLLRRHPQNMLGGSAEQFWISIFCLDVVATIIKMDAFILTEQDTLYRVSPAGPIPTDE